MALTSVWEARARRRPWSGATLPDHAEVAVVGGGLTGLTTALLLARAGCEVVLLEARELGAGTTGRSTAKLSVLQGSRLAEIRSRQTAGILRSYVEANREAQAWVARFAEEHGVGFERRPDYAYANGESGRHDLDRVQRAATGAGLDVRLVDDVPLPFPTYGAVRLDDQLQLDPIELVDALAAAAVAHGVQVVEGVRVRRVSGRGPVRVRLVDDRELAADRIVVATGMPMLDRGGFFARMSPARSYGLAFRTPQPAVDGMFLSVDQPSRSLRTARAEGGEPLLLVGGNGHTTGRTRSEQRRVEQLRSWTLEHFPDAVETHAWSAQDYLTHHGLPYAGPVLPGADRVLVAGGFAKWGMTNGVAAALAIAGQVLGGHQEWAAAFRTWSPREVRGLARGAVANGEVGVQLTLGWLTPPVRERGSVVCTHLGGVVRWNDAERSWDCPLHGSRFADDGDVLEGPATCGLRRRTTEGEQV